MSVTLRIILIVCSIFSFIFCVRRIKQSKLKVTNSVVWMLGSLMLILMSLLSGVVEWLSEKLGFIAPVNFVFFIMIAFLLIQSFIDNIRIYHRCYCCSDCTDQYNGNQCNIREKSTCTHDQSQNKP